MQRNREWFLKRYPVIFHVTYRPNLENITRNGLMSANALKRAAGQPNGFRRLEPRAVQSNGGTFILRDQKPMAPEYLRDRLIDLTPEQWYELMDDHIFSSWIRPAWINW
jgi:hypothetical protein